jgi:hypothetical protein
MASRGLLSHIHEFAILLREIPNTNEISAVSVKVAFAFAHNASSKCHPKTINSNHVRRSGSSSRFPLIISL